MRASSETHSATASSARWARPWSARDSGVIEVGQPGQQQAKSPVQDSGKGGAGSLRTAIVDGEKSHGRGAVSRRRQTADSQRKGCVWLCLIDRRVPRCRITLGPKGGNLRVLVESARAAQCSGLSLEKGAGREGAKRPKKVQGHSRFYGHDTSRCVRLERRRASVARCRFHLPCKVSSTAFLTFPQLLRRRDRIKSQWTSSPPVGPRAHRPAWCQSTHPGCPTRESGRGR